MSKNLQIETEKKSEKSQMKSLHTKLIFLALTIAFSVVILMTFFYIAKISIDLKLAIIVPLFYIICIAAIYFGLRMKIKFMLPSMIVTAAAVYSCVHKSIRVALSGDLLEYLQTTETILEGIPMQNLYTSIFPHVLKYPTFLSLFGGFFPNLRLAALFVNFISVVIAMISCYYFCKKFSDETFSLIAVFILAFNPVIIIYATLPNAEILYGTCMLVCLTLCLYIENNKKKNIVLALLAGLVCGIANFFRPLGIIIIIALCMYIFINHKLKSALIYIMLIIVPYLITVQLGHETPKPSYGWNLYVGSSDFGDWNQKDADLFQEKMIEFYDADETQQYFAKLAFERYGSMGFGIIKHCLSKLKFLFEHEYIANLLDDQVPGAPLYESVDKSIYSLIIFIIDIPIFLLGLFGAFSSAMKALKKEVSPSTLMGICFLGNIIVLMLLEASPRYSIAYRIFVAPLCCYGLNVIYKFLKSNVNVLKKFLID